MIVVGMSSGVSADGIEAALVEISGAPPDLVSFMQKGSHIPFPAELRERLLTLIASGAAPFSDLCAINGIIGEQFAHAVQYIVDEAGYRTEEVDLIGLGGQTLWHSDEGSALSGISVMQLGDPALIAQETGIPVISHFRQGDIAMGGHGAPLSAYADWLRLRHPTLWRAVQNIGGMSSVTFLPPLSADENAGISLAFDTGPGTVLMDAAVTEMTEGMMTYDADGTIAAQGIPDDAWLGELTAHPYFSRRPPKAVSTALFTAEHGRALFAQGQARNLSEPDIIATLVALTAASIADAYHAFAPAPIGEILVGGGGSQHPVLLQLMREYAGVPTITPLDTAQIDRCREAFAYAILAYERWHERPNTFPIFTGVRAPASVGSITYPPLRGR